MIPEEEFEEIQRLKKQLEKRRLEEESRGLSPSDLEQEPKSVQWVTFILGVLGYGVFGLFLIWLLWINAGGGYN